MKMKNYYVFAFMLGGLLTFISCSKTEENVSLTSEVVEITIENFVRPASLRNQEIPFSVINAEGVDVTDQATFFVNDEPIEGSVFVSSEVGVFEAYATYDDNGTEVVTTPESFEVIIPKRKVVVEDYTGTWCGFCPAVLGSMEEVYGMIPDDLALVAIHITANSNPDPLHFDDVDILMDEFNVNALPQGRIDRSQVWFAPYDIDVILDTAGQNTTSAMSLNSQIDGDQLITEVTLITEGGTNQGDKLVVYLLEDGILYDQTNYFNSDSTSPFYQMGDPMVDFEHNHTLRKSLTSVLGDPIPVTGALEEYRVTFNTSLPTSTTPPLGYVRENLAFVVMYVNEDNLAYNGQVGLINELVPYQ